MLSTTTSLLPFASSHRKQKLHAVSSSTTPAIIALHHPLQTGFKGPQSRAVPLTLQQYDDFELLWLEYRHGLSLSKAATLDVLRHVQLGSLPADADLLRGRAQQFAALGRRHPRLDTLRVLNQSCQHVLACDAE